MEVQKKVVNDKQRLQEYLGSFDAALATRLSRGEIGKVPGNLGSTEPLLPPGPSPPDPPYAVTPRPNAVINSNLVGTMWSGGSFSTPVVRLVPTIPLREPRDDL